MRCFLAVTFLCSVLGLFPKAAFSVEASRLEAREWGLPNFQERELDKDLPIIDVLVGENQNVWLLGQRSLWLWNLNSNMLQRVLILWEDKVLDQSKNTEKLVKLGSDGASIFVGSTRFVYQIVAVANESAPKVLRYKIPQSSKLQPVAFVGSGDRFMWLTSNQAFMLDRYGKKLQVVTVASPFKGSDRVLADAGGSGLTLTRDKQIFKVELNKNAKGEFILGKPELQQKLTNPVLGLHSLPDGYLVHTAFTALRHDTNGKRIQTMPVENDRRLAKITITEKQHGYLFEDGLLEVFDLQAEQTRRFQIPADYAKTSSSVHLAGDSNLLVLTDGKIKAYSLTRTVNSPRVSRK